MTQVTSIFFPQFRPYNDRFTCERGRKAWPGGTSLERHRRGLCVSKGRDGRGSTGGIALLYGFFPDLLIVFSDLFISGSLDLFHILGLSQFKIEDEQHDYLVFPQHCFFKIKGKRLQVRVF
jgi:hypothetical protein